MANTRYAIYKKENTGALMLVPGDPSELDPRPEERIGRLIDHNPSLRTRAVSGSQAVRSPFPMPRGHGAGPKGAGALDECAASLG